MSDIIPVHPLDDECFVSIDAQPGGSESVNSHGDVLSPDDAETIPFCWLLLAIAPFLLVPLAHWASGPDTATGLFHYELPYYVANGRAAFERGNGVLYPNPYDASADAPVIYAHWLPWIQGYLTAEWGADPGTIVLALTLCAAIGLAEVTRRLVAWCVPTSGTAANLVFLAAMWGGGALVLGGLVTQSVPTNATDLLRLDPGRGLWFLNWGRNALFPTEATYHILVAICWLTELQRRRLASTVCLLLLATTHPWSGLELLLTISLWRWIGWFRTRDGRDGLHTAIVTTILVGFLGYYKVWLPSFPQHAQLQSVWELDWSLPWSSAFPAWGVVALLAAARIARDAQCVRTSTVGFLLCAWGVATGLSLHDRLIAPVQPIHFTRGYVWMPLFLLGAPLLVDLGRQLWERSWPARFAVCGIGLLLAIDNITFSAVHAARQWQHTDGFHLDLHERALLARLHRRDKNAVVLTESMTLNYLLPTYAAVRPWLGHQFNTPEFPQKHDVMDACFSQGSVQVDSVPEEVNLLAVRRDRDCRELASSGEWVDWSAENADWIVWLRIPTDPETASRAETNRVASPSPLPNRR